MISTFSLAGAALGLQCTRKSVIKGYSFTLIQGTQQHSEVEAKLGVYIKDLPTMPVIPNMMPTSPLAASHKTLLKTLNQGKAPPSRNNKRQPSNSSEDEDSIVERRVSVRQSESAFRYKEIVVKKCPGYTQIWLFTSTKIKNALNPKVKDYLNHYYSYTYVQSYFRIEKKIELKIPYNIGDHHD